MGVADVVESDLGDTGSAGDPLEGLRDGVRVDRVAFDIGETHPVGSIPTAARPVSCHAFQAVSISMVVRSRSMARRELLVLPLDSCRSWPTETRPRLMERVALPRSTSSHYNPSNSLRRSPVLASSQKAANSRCPAVSRRNACSSWAVQACCSALGIALSFGA